MLFSPIVCQNNAEDLEYALLVSDLAVRNKAIPLYTLVNLTRFMMATVSDTNELNRDQSGHYHAHLRE
jgi:hypothetical protein